MNATNPFPIPRQSDTNTWTISRYADMLAVLHNPHCIVPPARETDREYTLRWLRAHVARFANGPIHDRRRALCEMDLARMGTDALRREAHRRAALAMNEVPGRVVDVMATVARPIPVRVLLSNLGVAEANLTAATRAVAEVAPVYLQPGDAPTPGADAAVQTLVFLLPEDRPETTANRIGLLMQAYEATAGLIGNALAQWIGCGPAGAETASIPAFLTETMRFNPPVRALRRVSAVSVELGGCTIPERAAIILDIAAANRDLEVFTQPETFEPDRQGATHLGFGAGVRPCPGAEHALALAAGVVTAVMERCTLIGASVTYGEPSLLRVPASLTVTKR